MDHNGTPSQRHPSGSLVLCQTSLGVEIQAALIRMAPHLVVFEIPYPHLVLQTSEVLQPFEVLSNGRQMYSGRAVVTNQLNAGETVICEARLDELWLRSGEPPSAKSDRITPDFREFIQHWQNTWKILPEYKLLISDMQAFLSDLRLWLQQIEVRARSAPSGDRLEWEHDYLEHIGAQVIPVISGFFDKFEDLAPLVERDLVPSHYAYMRRQLHPFVLCSPFAHRTFVKPLGYAGDYEMVNMILRNPYEGASMFAKILNRWFIEQPPAAAHRNRVALIENTMAEEALRVAAMSRILRVCNLGCGPAIEVQRFIASSALAELSHFTLVDFNKETIHHVQRAVENIKSRYHRGTVVEYASKSVQQLLKGANGPTDRPPAQQYDMVYCAGLFDYLADSVCHRLINLLYHWLKPGGLLLVTNVHPSNPLRSGMEHLLDWHLVYRDAARLRALLPSHSGIESACVRSEENGVNLLLTIRKSQNGEPINP
jgi:extracellular factor (EF) 3-hydroxypalmitic acid methyl ester biosynthesis protein